MNNLFETLDLETVSLCNRRCPTCIRNSHPDKSLVSSFFERNFLEMDVIENAFTQATELGFTGKVILSHYNEPLLDDRLPKICKLAKQFPFKYVYFHTNGDLITEDKALELDGFVDEIRITLYMPEDKSVVRAKWINSLFSKTKLTFLIPSHIKTHFSSGYLELAEKYKNHNCLEPQRRVAINHRRQYLLCCDDVVGNFDLGYFPDISIKDYWFGEKRVTLANNLQNVGGRLHYAYCTTCPRI